MTDTSTALDPHRSIKMISGDFFVPAYQRGYRWTKDDVRRLLEDIEESRINDNRVNDKAGYTLQPIVVRRRTEIVDKEPRYFWELIDGQQRLTTIYLIFLVMRDKGWLKSIPYTIYYDTRQRWHDFKTDVLEKSDSNIDYYHLATAYRFIDEWFSRWGNDFQQESTALQFFFYLTEHVKVIWYEPLANDPVSELRAEQEAITLFTRLNVGRIELTDAELVKAQLLMAVKVNSQDRAFELAAQWDSIERDLQRPDVWAFISPLNENEAAIAFPTRIGLLLQTLADKHLGDNCPAPGKSRLRYLTFETLRKIIKIDPKSFWNEVTALHAQIMGWQEDYEWHNRIGFLIATESHRFSDLVAEASTRKKRELTRWLKDQIGKAISLNVDQLKELSYDNPNHYRKLKNILLLFNIEALTRAKLHFPFANHVNALWSLEHIHAQQSKGLTTKKQWETWLRIHLKPLKLFIDEAIPPNERDIERKGVARDIEEALRRLQANEEFKTEAFENLHTRTIKFFGSGEEPDHSIRNLALLSIRDNSELSNAVFAAKRQIIIERDRKGEYIPLCTRHVFLKYYAPIGSEQWHFWSEDDKLAYYTDIIDRKTGIGSYLQRPNQETE